MVEYAKFTDGKAQYYKYGRCSPNLICRYNTIFVKVPIGFFIELENLNPKIYVGE